MSEPLEKDIIGSIALYPELIEKLPDLSDLLTSSYNRLIYRAEKKAFNQSLNIDLAIIVDELKGKVPADYISSLLDGFPKSQATIEVVLEKIRRLKALRLKKEILQETNEQNHLLLKKGIDPDISKLRELFEELDALNNGNRQILVPLSSISPKEVSWLWWNRIPLGSLTLVVGDPGEGKSLFCLWLAARLSKGDSLPDRIDFEKKGSTIYITAEDNLSDTIRPRSDEAGGDCQKIYVHDGMINNEVLTIPGHLGIVEKEIERIGDVLLIVFDPLTAFGVPVMSSTRDVEKTVRAKLTPLVRLAEKYSIAVIGVSHCNKSQAQKAVYRVLGSVDWTAAARTVWLIQKDENDEIHQRRFFSPLKYNICKNPTTLAFSIDGPLGHPRMTFESEPVDVSAAELLADDEGREKYSALREAREWLKQALNDGPILAREVFKSATENGISEPTLNRAKPQAGIESYKSEEGWYWRLKNA